MWFWESKPLPLFNWSTNNQKPTLFSASNLPKLNEDVIPKNLLSKHATICAATKGRRFFRIPHTTHPALLLKRNHTSCCAPIIFIKSLFSGEQISSNELDYGRVTSAQRRAMMATRTHNKGGHIILHIIRIDIKYQDEW